MESKEMTSIRKLLPKVPAKDYSVALDFLRDRNFSGLEGFINRIISKVEKDRQKEEGLQKYKDIDLDSLYELVTNISMITIHEDIKGY